MAFKIKTILLTIVILVFITAIYISYHDQWQPFAASGLQPIDGEQLAGGNATVFDSTQNAFGLPAPGLKDQEELLFFVGNSFFKQNWVTAPSSTTARDGLGPMFNARSCSGCHLKDGRGLPHENPEEASKGLLMRLSITGKTIHGGPEPVPVYGTQLQDQAVRGVEPEGKIKITYEEIKGQFADGTSYTLQKPHYEIVDPGYGPFPDSMMTSPRVAPQVVGVGLIEAIPDSAIIANADPDDKNGDGISGKPNFVWNKKKQTKTLGRFGWKANDPTLRQQNAAAFHGDMGITTPVFNNENCTPEQKNCNQAPSGGSPEISEDDYRKLVLYTSNLAVPARRNWKEKEVLKGRQIFMNAGCAGCHQPHWQTGKHGRFEHFSNQKIWPYTDLLLHDMGKGLADGRPDFEAGKREWRTPPLWGIGLVKTVNEHTRFLHDGRARNLMEAILWHGGEAESAKANVLQLNKVERKALIRFLNSL